MVVLITYSFGLAPRAISICERSRGGTSRWSWIGDGDEPRGSWSGIWYLFSTAGACSWSS